MMGGSKHKTNIFHRFLHAMVKPPPPPPETKKVRSKPPVHKFKYQLPKSFLDAVDKARLEAGYDVLPHFHHLSVSRSPHHQRRSFSFTRPSTTQHHHHHKERKRARSVSPSGHGNASSKKVHFQRATHKHSHQHRQKKLAASSSTIKTPKVSHRTSDGPKTPSFNRLHKN